MFYVKSTYTRRRRIESLPSVEGQVTVVVDSALTQQMCHLQLLFSFLRSVGRIGFQSSLSSPKVKKLAQLMGLLLSQWFSVFTLK